MGGLPGGNMKKTGLLMLLLATAAWAQTPADATAPQGTSPPKKKSVTTTTSNELGDH